MSSKFPEGVMIDKEDYLDEFKRINNVEYMEEDIFLDCLEDNGHDEYYWNTRHVQPIIIKRSKVRNLIKLILISFNKLTDWILSITH